ncbi:MAG: tetratricopeptide repeat protein, partial [Planctomycetes bacterium]|nr:tetratricopeptide repeat protein [Planctomycetota bacterium]
MAFNYGIITEVAARLKHYEQAVEYGEKSLNLSSNFSQASIVRNWLALAYFRLGRHQKAFELWEAALQEVPDMYSVYENMGDAYYLLGDLDQATINYNRALRLNPGLVQIRNNLQIIANLIRLDQSIADYSEKLRRSPNDPAIHSRLGYLYFQKGLHSQATEYWREAIRLQPDWCEPYINLAGLLATTKESMLRNPEEALLLAEKAAQLNEFKDAGLLETYSNIL